MKNFLHTIFVFFALFYFNSCSKPVDDVKASTVDSFVFYKGADISWVTQMEANNIKFYNQANENIDCFELLKSLGVNAIRLRVWKNPLLGWNNENDVLAKAKRANDLGLKLLIDFHYSDSWADPAQQNIPNEWIHQNFETLKQSVYTNYIY
jgi:arabinogalactan endo-1,4-beta-galactosidase